MIDAVDTALLMAAGIGFGSLLFVAMIETYNYFKHRKPKSFQYIGDDPENKELD